jgi:hypothetical protein
MHSRSWLAWVEACFACRRPFAPELCVAGLALSLPGYGDTEVEAGPLAEATRQGGSEAMATAKQLPWIEADQLHVYEIFP